MSVSKIYVAIVGLGFGAEYSTLLQKHPYTHCHGVCQREEGKLNTVGDNFGVEARRTDFQHGLKDQNVDVVHINSPLPDHAWVSLAALEAGRHFAGTLPLATSIVGCKGIVALARRAGLNCTTLEAVVYENEFSMALVEDRDPLSNARQSANRTCVGLCAHEAALKGGATL